MRAIEVNDRRGGIYSCPCCIFKKIHSRVTKSLSRSWIGFLDFSFFSFYLEYLEVVYIFRWDILLLFYSNALHGILIACIFFSSINYLHINVKSISVLRFFPIIFDLLRNICS